MDIHYSESSTRRKGRFVKSKRDFKHTYFRHVQNCEWDLRHAKNGNAQSTESEVH